MPLSLFFFCIQQIIIYHNKYIDIFNFTIDTNFIFVKISTLNLCPDNFKLYFFYFISVFKELV